MSLGKYFGKKESDSTTVISDNNSNQPVEEQQSQTTEQELVEKLKTVSSEAPGVEFHNDPNIDDIVEIKGVSQYYGDNVIIKDFNFLAERDKEKGVFKVILGPSGCGKSTVLRYISGLQEPSSGEIRINGRPRKNSDHVGMVFQKYSSFPWRTVLENVSYGLEIQNSRYDKFLNFFRKKENKKTFLTKKQIKEKSLEMIKAVGLAGHESKYAQYPTLSGGQLQRVAIARSLLATPDILLMDEPFGALDVPTRLQMQDMLANISRDLHPTIILITHDIPEAVYLADDIYIMSKAPSKIVKHINVSSILPSNRKGIKRTKEFTDLVQKIEDLMMEINSK